ncbi:MAG: serine hydrolase [Patescibacteria group bacterium]
MSAKNLKILLSSMLLSTGFWWGMNVVSESLENLFFQQVMGMNPEMFKAQLFQEQQWFTRSFLLPARKTSIGNPDFLAQSVLSVFVGRDGREKVLFRKNSDTPTPIASLTKLMTALIAIKSYPLDQEVAISVQALQEQGDVFTIKDLLYFLLIESSNDAASALGELMGREAFVDLMNQEAKNLGLANTFFVNQTGLDPEVLEEEGNYSTSEDLARFTRYLLNQYPQIFDILALKEFHLSDSPENFHHTLRNTNELLHDSSWAVKIIGGKTGFTSKAQGCLLLVVEAPGEKGYIINILLGSPDRFQEMKQLVDWVYESYQWEL